MTDPPMYNVASAVTSRSLAIVRSLPLPGCEVGCWQMKSMYVFCDIFFISQFIAFSHLGFFFTVIGFKYLRASLIFRIIFTGKWSEILGAV